MSTRDTPPCGTSPPGHLDGAVRLAPVVPAEHDLVIKLAPTARFLGLGAEERPAVAEGPLRDALAVPRPTGSRDAGSSCSTTSTPRATRCAMARALRLAGAADVGAVVLTRRKGWLT